MSCFPLLQLPTLAMEEVLKTMRIIQLVELSHTSTKCYKLVKQVVQEDFKIDLYAYKNDGEVKIHSKKDSYRFLICELERHIRYNSQFVSSSLALICSKDYTTEMSSITSHLTGLFERPIHHITIKHLTDSRLSKLKNWIETQKIEYKNLSIYAEIAKGRKLARALNDAKPTDGLELIVNFDFEFNYCFENCLKELRISDGYWFKIDHFFELKIEKLRLDHCLFTNEDLDELVKKWKSGELPNLKHIALNSHFLNNETPIAGMMPPIQTDEKNQIMKKIMEARVIIDGSVDIQSNNGAIGKLIVQPETGFFSLFISD